MNFTTYFWLFPATGLDVLCTTIHSKKQKADSRFSLSNENVIGHFVLDI